MEKKILVIDDEEVVSKSLIKLLKNNGYSAAIARSGQEAIERVKKDNFDLLVCDVRMPEMDGVETIKQIRDYLEKARKRPVPGVMITGYVDQDKYEKALDLEVVDYLSKPFDNNEFLRVVRKIIG